MEETASPRQLGDAVTKGALHDLTFLEYVVHLMLRPWQGGTVNRFQPRAAHFARDSEDKRCSANGRSPDGRGALVRIANAGIRAGGFTLIELLVVVVIIGLLAGLVAPRYFGQVGKSEVNVAKAQIDALEKALDQYRLDTGHYPDSELGLGALLERPASEPKWNGPYLRKTLPLDPWGKPYVYRIPGEKGEFDLVTFGKDGQPGGSGESADISNH